MNKPLQGWTILFDLDGTLVETAPDLLAALNHVLESLTLRPVEIEAVRGLIGLGAKAMLRRGAALQNRDLPEDTMDRLWHEFIAYYSKNIAVGSHAFEGVEDALAMLEELGAILAVCTNKPQALSEQLLSALGLSQRFAAIVGSDSVPDKKPHRDHILLTVNAAEGIPTKAIMVGDSRTDEKAARNAGLPFIFVPFGYETETAEQIGADAVVTHYSDLVSSILALAA